MRSISPIDISNNSSLASVGEDNTLIVWDLRRILKLDLLEYGCNWVRDYLRTNAEVEEGNTGNFVNSHPSSRLWEATCSSN